MRSGTLLVLLALILLFAAFGWKAFGYIALFVLILPILGLLAVVAALWVVRRRMERRLAELGHTAAPNAPRRGDAIDVEGTVRKPRDGADDPDQLAQGR